MNKYLLIAFIPLILIGCGGSSSSSNGPSLEEGSPENDDSTNDGREPETTVSPFISDLSMHMGPENSPEIVADQVEEYGAIEINTKVDGELEFLSVKDGSFIEFSFNNNDEELVAFILSGATDTTTLSVYSDSQGFHRQPINKGTVIIPEIGSHYTIDIADEDARNNIDFSLTVASASRSLLGLTYGQFYVKTSFTSLTICDGETAAYSSNYDEYEIWDFHDNSMFYGNESTYNKFDSVQDNMINISATDVFESDTGTITYTWAQTVTVNAVENKFPGTIIMTSARTGLDGTTEECLTTGTTEGSIVL